MVKEQLHKGKTEVRSILGGEAIVVTDAEIEESLWHYYYDVDKTVNYLRSMWSIFYVHVVLSPDLSERAPGQKNPQPKKLKKKTEVAEAKIVNGRHESSPSLLLRFHCGFPQKRGELATKMAGVF